MTFAMEYWNHGLPVPIALALVALLGYLVGRVRTNSAAETRAGNTRRVLERAAGVARELELIAQQIRTSLATHHSSIAYFRDRVNEMSRRPDGVSWEELSHEAETMLKPTMRLSAQVAHAYDQLRQQTNLLMTFTEVRTDPLTGLRNRRSLDEALDSLIALMNRYGTQFSLVVFDVDHFKRINDRKGHLEGDRVLQQVARLLDESVRDTDIVTRFGGEEFVIVMPESDLAGASIFAERVRRAAERQLELTISGGVAAALEGDTEQTLLNRADSALYMAKSSGRNCVFQHSGHQVESVTRPLFPAEAPQAREVEQPASD